MKGRTRIKFCGMRRAEDAICAAELGADAIGMVFYPAAKRCISIEIAREIIAALPAFVTPVGLFVNQSSSEVIRIATELELRHIQLHGAENIQQINELAPRSVIKAVRFGDDLAPWTDPPANLKAVILEPANSTGGSGIENDWSKIEQLKNAGVFNGLPPIILAGGLNPENVRDAVRRIRPFAVDVSSGIESEFGKKSPDKMRAFVEAVREADSQ